MPGHSEPGVGIPPQTLPVRDRCRLTDEVLRHRLENMLLPAMRKSGLDMWLVICEEDNLDPVLPTLIPEDSWCPILQILVFFDPGGGDAVERISLSMTDTHDLYDRPWQGRETNEQWHLLRKIVDERDPRRIGLNTGPTQWAAGGLPHHLYLRLCDVLSPSHIARFESAEELCVRWLAVLSPKQIRLYDTVIEAANPLIAECYSPKALTPGGTTTADLHWHYRQRCADLGLQVSFTPSFYLTKGPAARQPAQTGIIEPGDLVRCDVGIRYLGLCSDHQRQLYVLPTPDAGIPVGLGRLLDQAHHLQDIFMDEMREGLTGNELLARILLRAGREGVAGARVYSHSLGVFLHEPGALIGLPWEQQRCEGRGEVRIMDNTAYTMELSVEDHVPEWGTELRLGLEEDVIFTGGKCRVIGSRQEGFYTL